MPRDFHLPGRSPVISGEAMAATSHPLATMTALDTLRAGGNAVDAAVAACAVLGVIEPQSTGIGGDCFCMISQPGKPVWGYNGCGRSGGAASLDKLLGQGHANIGMTSVHAVTVPGAIEAWDTILKTHGRFGLDRALQPAIKFAEHGFPVASRIAHVWHNLSAKLAADTGTARHFLSGGRAPTEGDIVKFSALAATMKAIAAKGWRAFYEGEIAHDIVETLRAKGSFLTEEDFARHKGEVQSPISTNYRGLDILELPPNGQGLTALVMLNILENFDMKSFEPLGPDRFHIMLEAARLAYGVRDTHIADPAFMRVKPEALIDKAFARKLAAKIDTTKRTALPPHPTPDSDTVYLTVVDKDRMAVSFINSLYSNFGVGITTDKTGVMLTNRGACFVVDPKHPNVFGPNKRPMHTIIPAHAMRDGRCEMTFGVMGSHFQPMGHTQVILNMVDYGMDVQQAIDAPRIFFEGEDTMPERGVAPETLEGLRKRGHKLVTPSAPWGGGQAIVIDWKRGVLIGGSEPRKDGAAIGY
jgi:gamma-glutamyltranspeptidase/glutathione hydrolase